MHADDAVVFKCAKDIQEASLLLTSAVRHFQDWLTKKCFLLNKKNGVFDFYKTTSRFDIF